MAQSQVTWFINKVSVLLGPKCSILIPQLVDFHPVGYVTHTLLGHCLWLIGFTQTEDHSVAWRSVRRRHSTDETLSGRVEHFHPYHRQFSDGTTAAACVQPHSPSFSCLPEVCSPQSRSWVQRNNSIQVWFCYRQQHQCFNLLCIIDSLWCHHSGLLPRGTRYHYRVFLLLSWRSVLHITKQSLTGEAIMFWFSTVCGLVEKKDRFNEQQATTTNEFTVSCSQLNQSVGLFLGAIKTICCSKSVQQLQICSPKSVFSGITGNLLAVTVSQTHLFIQVTWHLLLYWI